MNKLLLAILIIFFAVSCVPFRNTIYLQNKSGSSNDLMVNKKVQYRICPNDLLQINVTSSNIQISEIFNLKTEGEKFYSVNDSGYVFMPVLDSVQVGGKTIPEIQGLIRKLIREHVTDAIVIVNLSKFNVTVLGEVQHQGSVSAKGEELTIMDALGFAGGINDFGNKKKIKLIRKRGGSTEITNLDLTDRKVISSEYFFLQPNDIVYVEPLRVKNLRTNLSQISLIVGLASFALLLNNAFKIF